MTPEEARVTGASVPVTLGDTTYNLRTLSDRDIAELDEWVRSEYIRTSLSGIPDGMTAKVRDAYFGVISSKALGLTWISGEGARMIATLPGVARLFWQSAKANHPTLTYEECRKLIMNADAVRMVNSGFRRANTLPSNSKRQAARRRKQSSTTNSAKRTS